MSHPFLKGFSNDQLATIARCGRLREYGPADLIFKQGHPAHTFHLILSGTVVLTHAGQKGNTVIQTLATGEVVGWSWLFSPYSWHFNATASDPTQILELDGDRLRELCQTEHNFGYEFMSRIAQVVIERLQYTRRKLFKLSGTY